MYVQRLAPGQCGSIAIRIQMMGYLSKILFSVSLYCAMYLAYCYIHFGQQDYVRHLQRNLRCRPSALPNNLLLDDCPAARQEAVDHLCDHITTCHIAFPKSDHTTCIMRLEVRQINALIILAKAKRRKFFNCYVRTLVRNDNYYIRWSTEHLSMRHALNFLPLERNKSTV